MMLGYLGRPEAIPSMFMSRRGRWDKRQLCRGLRHRVQVTLGWEQLLDEHRNLSLRTHSAEFCQQPGGAWTPGCGASLSLCVRPLAPAWLTPRLCPGADKPVRSD